MFLEVEAVASKVFSMVYRLGICFMLALLAFVIESGVGRKEVSDTEYDCHQKSKARK